MSKELDKKLKKLAEKLKTAKLGTRAHDRIMDEIDELLGMDEESPDHELEADWEKAK